MVFLNHFENLKEDNIKIKYIFKSNTYILRSKGSRSISTH